MVCRNTPPFFVLGLEVRRANLSVPHLITGLPLCVGITGGKCLSVFAARHFVSSQPGGEKAFFLGRRGSSREGYLAGQGGGGTDMDTLIAAVCFL